MCFSAVAHLKRGIYPKKIKELKNVEIYSADVEPANEIRLVSEVTYRDTGEIFLGQIIPAVEADSSGQAYILDLQKNSVHVFDSKGDYLQSIGSEGRGPGEFIFTAKFYHNIKIVSE